MDIEAETPAHQTEGAITVRGDAIVPGEPNEVRSRLEVSATHPRSEDALAEVAERSHLLDTLLSDLGISKAKRSTSGLTVREKREWINERSIHRGYEALGSVLVRPEDPAVAGRLMQGAVEQAQAHIEGPGGTSTGLRRGPVRSIAEAAVATPWSRGGRMLAMADGPTAAAEIGIDAGELEVSASVTITFGIEP
jgi:uncharacterized protein YggE